MQQEPVQLYNLLNQNGGQPCCYHLKERNKSMRFILSVILHRLGEKVEPNKYK